MPGILADAHSRCQAGGPRCTGAGVASAGDGAVEAVSGVAETGDDVARLVEALVERAEDDGEVAALRRPVDRGEPLRGGDQAHRRHIHGPAVEEVVDRGEQAATGGE